MSLPVIDWLLASDPSIRWQVMRDLLDAPEPVWRAERAKVETEGWGARLLSHQDDDGQWAGGAFVPAGFDAREWSERGQPWTATCFSLSQLDFFRIKRIAANLKETRTPRRLCALPERSAPPRPHGPARRQAPEWRRRRAAWRRSPAHP